MINTYLTLTINLVAYQKKNKQVRANFWLQKAGHLATLEAIHAPSLMTPRASRALLNPTRIN